MVGFPGQNQHLSQRTPTLSAPTAIRYLDETSGHGPYRAVDGEHRPIFVVSADMIPPDAYGRGRYAEAVRTPNLDSMGEDGVAFRNAFCNAPLCGPSRASYLTGRYTYLTVNEERAHDGFPTELRRDDPIFPEYLRAEGYTTRHVGKCHVGTDKFMQAFGENDSPWNRWAPPIYDDDEYRAYLRELGVKGFRLRKEIRGLMPDRRSPGNSYGGWVEQSDGSEFPPEATYPWFLARKAAETVRLLADERGPERPIYLQLDFFAPHQPFFIPSGFEGRAAELREVVELPESYRELRDRDFGPAPGDPPVYHTYARNWGLYEADTLRDYIVANLLNIELVDRALGVFLNALRSTGLYDASLVVFLGDHGEMNGEKGLIDKGVYGHPRVVRVPLLVKMPEGQAAGRTVEDTVCLLDLAPTIFEFAGIRPSARLDGVSLLPAIGGRPVERHVPFLFEAGWHVTANPAAAIVDDVPGQGLFLYTYNVTSPRDELYRLGDPACRNLAGDEKWQGARGHMIRRMAGVLSAERRWRCYWHAFRLDKFESLDVEVGDAQMFVPD